MSNLFLIIAVTLVALAVIFLLRRNFGPASNDNNSQQKDAARFARLLISEIKLYETSKLERGLQTNDLYESLKDEIEEARKKFKGRIPANEHLGCFDNALIEILADGDRSKLGLSFQPALIQ